MLHVCASSLSLCIKLPCITGFNFNKEIESFIIEIQSVRKTETFDMESLSNIPITIIVKAPNQKIGDQTIECFMDWTVQRLKSQIAAVYPNRPKEENQRIIYSGKLLQDSSTLKDILRVIDDETLHTVHLVCSATCTAAAEDQNSSDNKSASDINNSVNGAPTGTINNDPLSASTSRQTSLGESSSSTDGLRQRHVSRTDSRGSSNSSSPYMQQYSFPSNNASFSAYQNLSPQQMQWMQQMYAHQMAAYYMQYSNSGQSGTSMPWTAPAMAQGAYPFHQPFGNVPAANYMPRPDAPAAAAAPVNNNVVPQAAVNVQQPVNNVRPAQNQPMNAGVGPAINDDEEEGLNRDWLDWIYTLCRFGVLLSIVYFYSSMNRFLLVAGIMLVVYLYERNFFRLLRRQGPRGNEPERNNAANVPEDNVAEAVDSNVAERINVPEADVNINEGERRDDVTEDTTNSQDNTESVENRTDVNSTEETLNEEPIRPGILAMTWVFITTFFTSLIPHGPRQHLPAGN